MLDGLELREPASLAGSPQIQIAPLVEIEEGQVELLEHDWIVGERIADVASGIVGRYSARLKPAVHIKPIGFVELDHEMHPIGPFRFVDQRVGVGCLVARKRVR
eukprot:752093-Prymnesium_polylepis.1